MLNISMKIYIFFLFQNNVYALQKKHLKKNRKTILEKNMGQKDGSVFWQKCLLHELGDLSLTLGTDLKVVLISTSSHSCARTRVHVHAHTQANFKKQNFLSSFSQSDRL